MILLFLVLTARCATAFRKSSSEKWHATPCRVIPISRAMDEKETSGQTFNPASKILSFEDLFIAL